MRDKYTRWITKEYVMEDTSPSLLKLIASAYTCRDRAYRVGWLNRLSYVAYRTYSIYRCITWRIINARPTNSASSSVHTPSERWYDVCFGKFARRHGYAFGRRRGATVIKFCTATQLLFGRGPTGSFAFKILRVRIFVFPLSFSLCFTLFFLSKQQAFFTGQFPLKNSRRGKILSTQEETVKKK